MPAPTCVQAARPSTAPAGKAIPKMEDPRLLVCPLVPARRDVPALREAHYSFWNSLSVAVMRPMSGCAPQYSPSFLAFSTNLVVLMTGGSSSSL
jgi:hypothetical protein